MTLPLLDVQNLRVSFPGPQGDVEVVKGLSLQVGNERVGIVGESGSGKSMTGRAMMGLIPKPGRVSADRLMFKGQNMLSLPESKLRPLRGTQLSMILQDPKFSLNPVMTIGAQISEVLEFHTKLSRKERRAKVMEALEAVRIHDPERVYGLYPHEVSGGMGQRVMIAMMVILEPALLIADEPTSALDVSVRGQVLEILDNLVKRRGMGLLMISHDLGMVSRWCDRILVMYRGKIVEECAAGALHLAQHPYTQGLLASQPLLDDPRPLLPVLNRAELGETA